ncbi:MAG: DUF4405 domain-containing protein [Anaerolineaceae bacterium]|nr:DUF4405 domain-containing protein [Anaerolineaceae bacterium]
MKENLRISNFTRNNWLLDITVIISAISAGISGIYFLFFVNGYQGGRNPFYNIKIIFNRSGWELIHTWTGVLLIIVLTIHLFIHWNWVVNMIKRTIKTISGEIPGMNGKTLFNIFINSVVAFTFLLTAVSGIYFLFFPSSGGISGPQILFSSNIWDLIHTWAGIFMIIAAVIHFAIHWKWVTKVSTKMFKITFAKAKATN